MSMHISASNRAAISVTEAFLELLGEPYWVNTNISVEAIDGVKYARDIFGGYNSFSWREFKVEVNLKGQEMTLNIVIYGDNQGKSWHRADIETHYIGNLCGPSCYKALRTGLSWKVRDNLQRVLYAPYGEYATMRFDPDFYLHGVSPKLRTKQPSTT